MSVQNWRIVYVVREAPSHREKHEKHMAGKMEISIKSTFQLMQLLSISYFFTSLLRSSCPRAFPEKQESN